MNPSGIGWLVTWKLYHDEFFWIHQALRIPNRAHPREAFDNFLDAEKEALFRRVLLNPAIGEYVVSGYSSYGGYPTLSGACWPRLLSDQSPMSRDCADCGVLGVCLQTKTALAGGLGIVG